MDRFKVTTHLDRGLGRIAAHVEEPREAIAEPIDDDSYNANNMTVIRYASLCSKFSAQCAPSTRNDKVQAWPYNQPAQSAREPLAVVSGVLNNCSNRSNKFKVQEQQPPLNARLRKRQPRAEAQPSKVGDKAGGKAWLEDRPMGDGMLQALLSSEIHCFPADPTSRGPAIAESGGPRDANGMVEGRSGRRQSLFSPFVSDAHIGAFSRNEKAHAEWRRAFEQAGPSVFPERGRDNCFARGDAFQLPNDLGNVELISASSRVDPGLNSPEGPEKQITEKLSELLSQCWWPSGRGSYAPTIFPSTEGYQTVIVHGVTRSKLIGSASSSIYEDEDDVDSMAPSVISSDSRFSEEHDSLSGLHDPLVEIYLAGVIDVDFAEFRDTFHRYHWVSSCDMPLPERANATTSAKYIRAALPLVLELTKTIAWCSGRFEELRASLEIMAYREVVCVEEEQRSVAQIRELIDNFSTQCTQRVMKHTNMPLSQVVSEATKFKDILETSGKIGVVERMYYGRRIAKTAQSIQVLLSNLRPLNISIMQSAISILRKYHRCVMMTRKSVRNDQYFHKEYSRAISLSALAISMST